MENLHHQLAEQQQVVERQQFEIAALTDYCNAMQSLLEQELANMQLTRTYYDSMLHGLSTRMRALERVAGPAATALIDYSLRQAAQQAAKNSAAVAESDAGAAVADSATNVGPCHKRKHQAAANRKLSSRRSEPLPMISESSFRG